MTQNTNQNRYKETLTRDKKEFLMKENGKQSKVKVENANNVVRVDQQCSVFIIKIHLKKS